MEAEAEGLAPDTSALEILDISGVEERVYLTLLASRSSTGAQIARELGINSNLAQQALAEIEAKGLVTRVPNAPTTYVATAPEFAIEALIKQRQRELEQARSAIPILTEAFVRSAASEGGQPILELITDRARLNLVVAHMYQSFRSEIVSFQRAPVLVPGAHTAGNLPHGTRTRSISDESFLKAPGALGVLREDIDAGEQARTFPNLPFKMMVVDRSSAIITLDSECPETAPTLLIHRGALIEALSLLFEFVWEKATPVLMADEHPGIPKGGSAADSAKALIPMLAAGLNDKAIAQELHVSASTLNRRIGDLMDAYGVRTRFQLGVQIALHAEAPQLASTAIDGKK